METRVTIELSRGAAKLRSLLTPRAIARCARAVGVSRQAVLGWRDGRSLPTAPRRISLRAWSAALGDPIEPIEWDQPARAARSA